MQLLNCVDQKPFNNCLDFHSGIKESLHLIRIWINFYVKTPYKMVSYSNTVLTPGKSWPFFISKSRVLMYNLTKFPTMQAFRNILMCNFSLYILKIYSKEVYSILYEQNPMCK